MLDLIKKHLNALQEGNWDDFRASLAGNAIYEEVATQQRFEGGDKFVAAVQRWKKGFPDLRGTVIDSVFSGDKGMVEVEWTGTHNGVLESPFGTIRPTNRQVLNRGVLSLRFVDGKIAESRHYFDLYGLMGQLGLAPIQGVAAPESKQQPASKS